MIILIIFLIILYYYFNNIFDYFTNTNTNKYYKIIIYYPYDFSMDVGGVLILAYFAFQVNKLVNNKIVYLFNEKSSLINTENIYFDNFTNDYNFDKENTIVIYAEGIQGNPLDAKHVIRWILADIELYSDNNIYKSWNKNDLIYYFNKEKKMIKNPEKIGNIYKLLTLIYLNPKITITNFEIREGWCFTYRKSNIHKNLVTIHPQDSFELDRFISQNKCIIIFNKYKYFVCYDSLTFMIIISLLCGCITIIYPIKGISKQEWLKLSIFGDYLKDNNLDNIYGLAYGIEDLSYAETTINKAPEFINKMINSINNKYLYLFLDDIKNLQNKKFENTVENNYLTLA